MRAVDPDNLIWISSVSACTLLSLFYLSIIAQLHRYDRSHGPLACYYITISIPIWEQRDLVWTHMDYDRLSVVFSVSNLFGPRSIFLSHNRYFQLPLDLCAKDK